MIGGDVLKKHSFGTALELPPALSASMAKDPYAYSCFARLSHEQRRDLISQAENARKRSDMTAVMDSILGGGSVSGSPYRTRN